MATEYQQRLCEFCLTKSDILEPHEHDAAGWTEVDDVEGALDRCPDCTAGALPRTLAPTEEDR